MSVRGWVTFLRNLPEALSAHRRLSILCFQVDRLLTEAEKLKQRDLGGRGEDATRSGYVKGFVAALRLVRMAIEEGGEEQ
jgi:hypothetical protein